KKVRPSKYAIPVTEDERAEQGTPRGGKKPRLHEDQREPFSPLPSPAAHSTVSTQVATGDVMGEEMKKEKTPDGLTAMRRPPGERIKKEPWSFVGLALAMGVAAGVMLRFKSLRRALKVYSFVRRLG
ncbi:MAG TPA: hypothetical protein VHH88_05840, partial [Verrucomicrobiae bacterium]|nr:hypothetical protein [Verrucomicrobiae bacterium]